MSEVIKWAMGFDAAESVAYHVACQSILNRSSLPVTIMPIKRSMLKDLHNRPLDPKQSNEFSFTRYLVPYLNNYEGWTIWSDSDILVLDDVKKLWDMRDDRYAVMCVKHDYTPSSRIKYLGNIQYPYEKKNWSSVLLFNNEKCKALTPEYVNEASGLELHQFKWLEGDRLIGDLPKEWNHLVGEQEPNAKAKLIHYTLGIPAFTEYQFCEHADKWFDERAVMQTCVQYNQPRAKESSR